MNTTPFMPLAFSSSRATKNSPSYLPPTVNAVTHLPFPHPASHARVAVVALRLEHQVKPPCMAPVRVRAVVIPRS